MGVRPALGWKGRARRCGPHRRPSGRAPQATGSATIPSDRYLYGLTADLSVVENFGLAGLAAGRYGSWWVASGQDARRHRSPPSPPSRSRAAGRGRAPAFLSGGNAQKLVLARELSGGAGILVAHSPTRGLDVRACAAIQSQLLEARDRGAAILLISEDLDEVLDLSDRVGVLNRGRIVGEFARPADRTRRSDG